MGRAVLPFNVYDAFSGRTTNRGFDRADSGPQWRVFAPNEAEAFSVDGQAGHGVIQGHSARNHGQPDITFLNTENLKSQGMVFAFSPTQFGSYTDFGPVLLRNSKYQYLFLRMQAGPNWNYVSFTSTAGVASGTPALTRLYPQDDDINRNPLPRDHSYYRFTMNRNQWYWCRVEYVSAKPSSIGWTGPFIGAQVRVRLWGDGEIEPSDWGLVIDVSRQYVYWTEGTMGFMSFSTTDFQAKIRTLYTYTDLDVPYANGAEVASFQDYPIDDTFDRAARDGLGAVPGDDLVWYGSMLDSPLVPGNDKYGQIGVDAKQRRCAVLGFDQAYAQNGGYWGFLGNTTEGNLEVLTQFATGASDGKIALRVGMRGTEGVSKNAIAGTGYAVQIMPNGTNSRLALVQKSTFGSGNWEPMDGTSTDTQVLTRTMTLTPDLRYWARVQLEVKANNEWAMRAKVWLNGEEEPSAWSLVAKNDPGKVAKALKLPYGSLFVNTSATPGATITANHRFYLYDIRAQRALTESTEEVVDDIVFSRRVVTQSLTETQAQFTFTYTGPAVNPAKATLIYDPNAEDKNFNLKTVTITTSTLPAASKDGDKKVTVTLSGLPKNTKLIVAVILKNALGEEYKMTHRFQTAFYGLLLEAPKAYDITTSGFMLSVPYTTQRTIDRTDTYPQAKIVLLPERSAKYIVGLTMKRHVGKTPVTDGSQFLVQVQDLLPDTAYRATITIRESADDTEPVVLTTTVQTEGDQPDLYFLDPLTGLRTSPIQIEAGLTSARVTMHYRWDVANRINFRVQHRQMGLATNNLWESYTSAFYKKTTIQDEKSWTALLIGLAPGRTYEVRVRVQHPGGTKNNRGEYVVTFTTQAAGEKAVKRPKHYLFKVYSNEKRRYLGTLNDVYQPEFSFHENGGVSDMTLRLPWTANKVNDARLQFGNRVDCWVIDHTSNGIGPNMIVDSDMDFGGWFLGSNWSVSPRGGPDESAALKVVAPTASYSDYALSEYITLANPEIREASSNDSFIVTIAVSNLLEEWEDNFARKEVNFEKIARRFRAQIEQLYPDTNRAAFKQKIDPQVNSLLGRNGLLRRAIRASYDFSLISSVEFTVSVQTYSEALEIQANAAQSGCVALINEQLEYESVPYVLRMVAKAGIGTITAQMEYYGVEGLMADSVSVDSDNTVVTAAVSEESVSTIGTEWQVLKMVFTPPLGTKTMRVRLTTQGETVGFVDKVYLMPQELLIYRGTIEAVKTTVDPNTEIIEVEVLGLAAKLTDYYVRFAQWVDRQPKRDQPRLVDPYMFDTDDPPVVINNPNMKQTKPREVLTGDERQSAIVFPKMEASYIIVRVYYDGDANADDNNGEAKCRLYYTRCMEATFPAVPDNADTANKAFDDISAGFGRGASVRMGKKDGTVIRESADESAKAIATVKQGTVLKISSDTNYRDEKDGWTWFKVTTPTKKTGWVIAEYLKKSEDTNSFFWHEKNKPSGRSTGWKQSGSLIDRYNFSLTKNDPDEKSDDEYSPSAHIDKRYFEFKVSIDALQRRRNYQFVARIFDPDGVLDASNNIVVNAKAINTATRILFPELVTTSELLGVQDSRYDTEERTYKPPTDPTVMLRSLIDLARSEDPKFFIGYNAESTKTTGTIAQYTFRDVQLRNALDKLRELCPPGWHWFVDANGLLHLRGPQHTATHYLHVSGDVLKYNLERNIKNVKNVVLVRGRQDSDASEPDGLGSIIAEARNEQSIAKYGARVLYLRDSNIKDTQTAQTVANGRLEELSIEEEQGSITVVDEKEIDLIVSPLHGYNIEAFRPGDYVVLDDAARSDERPYWDRAMFNQSRWDAGDRTFVEDGIPIKAVTYKGTHVELTLSQRPPSATGDFAKLVRWQQLQESTTKE